MSIEDAPSPLAAKTLFNAMLCFAVDSTRIDTPLHLGYVAFAAIAQAISTIRLNLPQIDQEDQSITTSTHLNQDN